MVNTGGSLEPMEQAFSLPVDVNDYSFNKFVDAFFSTDHTFQARYAPLTSPLLPTQHHDVAKDALAIFQMVSLKT